jgi:hypothetical protein
VVRFAARAACVRALSDGTVQPSSGVFFVFAASLQHDLVVAPQDSLS